MTGAELIAAEREKQVTHKGFSSIHDDAHKKDELIKAAIAYIEYGDSVRYQDHAPLIWPWSDKDWKPRYYDNVRNLVKAGALIAAEIDRLQRLETKK